MSNGRISVGPKKTLAELEAATGRLSPEPGVAGQPVQEYDEKLKINHWKYHRHLDPSWDNAAWAEHHDNKAPDSPYNGDKYFDRTGKKQNDDACALARGWQGFSCVYRALDPRKP